MTNLYDDPAAFADDMLAGFADVHRGYVEQVPGGVVRATRTPPGKVAVVVGGGSGHYPAFCGLVGPGFADGAVVGNVFTSPSAADAASVGRHAHGDSGVLFLTGNYAGDVINFEQAVSLLIEEEIDARYLVVTDDVASAPPSEREKRRGIAGDFTVFKVAAAAADAGYNIDDVVRVSTKANDHTRTLGVAFDGCTMPGAVEPLFTVEQGRMGLGLGIHGEPGIADADLPSASELAETLVKGVLDEAPTDASDRVAVILNGLGATKYEELFIVWRSASRLLRDSGLGVVQPEVGELVTSLDMAGCSLTVMWLDDELDRLWRAPADTPAYRKGVLRGATGERRAPVMASTIAAEAAAVPDADNASRASAAIVVRALDAMADAIAANETHLGEIDAIAGDGDHGRGMLRGVTSARDAARAATNRGSGAGNVLVAAGREWAAKAGGTSGVLWGAALEAAGRRIGDKGTPRPETLAAAAQDALDTIMRLGNAKPGDKTMLDALTPFVDALSKAVRRGKSLDDAWSAATTAAEVAANATAELRPKVGRARPLAERSLGTPDPGAISLALCLRAALDAVACAANASAGGDDE